MVEELYKKYNRNNRNNKVKNIIDTNLIFKFPKKLVEPSAILAPVIFIVCVLMFQVGINLYLFIWIPVFYVIYIIANKLQTYKVKFTDESIIIQYLSTSKTIYIKDVVNIYIEREYAIRYGRHNMLNFLGKQIFEEGKYNYNLIISYNNEYDSITITSTFSSNTNASEKSKRQIEQFINNFSYYEDDKYDKDGHFKIRFKM